MRFGILGAGVIGTVHARLIASIPDDEATLVAVADTSGEAAERLAGANGCVALSGVEDLVARDDVDAVSVCLPSGLHAKAAVTALDAGKHVIVEKPIDITLAAADEIIAAERRSGRVVTVISQRRFQPGFRFLHDAAASGWLGRVTLAIAESTFWRSQGYYDSDDWRGTLALDGGGALMNQGIHALDLVTWIMGKPVEVSAYSATLAHERIEVEDTLTASIRFAGGALATLTATTGAYPDRPVRLTVTGDAGTAVVANERLAYLSTRDSELGDLTTGAGGGPGGSESAGTALAGTGLAGTGLAGTAPVGTVFTGTEFTGTEFTGTGDPVRDASTPIHVDDAHRAQYLDFLAAVRDHRPPLVTTADGRRALALVLASYESARSGGQPVAVA